MTTTAEAVYENGAVYLIEPLELPEGEHVWIIKKQEDRLLVTPVTEEAQSPADIVAEISSLAVWHGVEETSSRDHDKILYGPEGVR